MKHGYSSLQIAIHWTVAALVAANWFLGGGMGQVYRAVERGEEVTEAGAAYAHVIVGLAVLLLMVGRLAARWSRPVAVAPDSSHRLMATLGRANHVTLYALLVLIPVLGALAWFGGVEAAGGLHELAVNVLLVLVALHVAGVIVHQVMGDGILHRMVRSTGGT